MSRPDTEPMSATGIDGAVVGQIVRHVRERMYAECDAAAIVAAGSVAAERSIRELALMFIAEQRRVLPADVVEQVVNAIVAATLGNGPLDALLADPTISEIMVNGPRDIWIERAGELIPVDVQFDDDEHVRHVIDRILAPIGRRLDAMHAMVDARLPDGSRVNAIIPPLAVDGPIVTIRRFVPSATTLADLHALGMCSDAQLDVIRSLVRERQNVVVCGPTSSGKTTLLAASLASCSSAERIIVIEDASELSIDHPHCIRMESRPPSFERSTEVTVRDLVRNSLRMRPDRIVVGEVRGAEAFDLIQALSTGHRGSWSSVHARGSVDALLRLESMALAAGVGVPEHIIRQQIDRSIDVVIHVDRSATGQRRVMSIDELSFTKSGWQLAPIPGDESCGREPARYECVDE